MTAQFRILFSGAILEGFELDKVKVAAGDKLKANPAQVDRLFSGKRAVLKKNLEEDKAEQYLRVLKRIGMDVRLEKEEQELELAPIQLDLVPQAPEPVQAPVENYDPEKTLLSNPALAAGLLDAPAAGNERASLDDLPSLESELQLVDEASGSHEATMVVSPMQAEEFMKPQAESANASHEATLIVSRDDIARLQAQQKAAAAASANEATLIVSPSDAARFIAQQKGMASSSEVTMIVNPGDVAHLVQAQKAAASSSHEETLIVSPSMVKNFVAEQKAAAAAAAPAAPTPAPAQQVQKPAPSEGSSNTVLHFGVFLALLVTAVAIYLFW